jgi:hypothetical protein
MKILNLDKISPAAERILELDGKKHDVLPVSVGNFLSINDLVVKMAEATPAEQLNMIVDSIVTQVPTVSRDRLLEFDLVTVNTIAAYVRGEDVEGQEEVLAEAVQTQAGK